MTMHRPTPENIAKSAPDDAATMTGAAQALADYQARTATDAIYVIPLDGEGALADRVKAMNIEGGPIRGSLRLGPERRGQR